MNWRRGVPVPHTVKSVPFSKQGSNKIQSSQTNEGCVYRLLSIGIITVTMMRVEQYDTCAIAINAIQFIIYASLQLTIKTLQVTFIHHDRLELDTYTTSEWNPCIRERMHKYDYEGRIETSLVAIHIYIILVVIHIANRLILTPLARYILWMSPGMTWESSRW